VAEGARRRLLPLAPAVAWAVLLFWLSAQSRPLPVELPIRHVDKLLHLGAYAVLGFLLAGGLRAAGVRPRRAFVAAVLVASLYGASDEWHQAFVPGRDADPGDWAADTVGALLGAAVVGLPRRGAQASIRG
jgi:VanZ family protein